MSYWLTIDVLVVDADPAPLEDCVQIGHVVVDRSRRDHDAGGVDARVPRQPFERRWRSRAAGDSARRCGTACPTSASFSIASFTVSEKFGWFGISLASASVSAGVKPSMRPTSLIAARDFSVPNVTIWQTDSLAVLLPHVLDHLAAPLEAEVDVDVGHRDALGIQEALEEEVVLERADVGDAERVRDQRARRRAAARSDRDAAVARRLDEVGDDQEVAGVAGLRDDAQLVVEPLAHVGGQRIAVALLRARRSRASSAGRSRSRRPPAAETPAGGTSSRTRR